MLLPKDKRKQKQFMKTCQYKDCGKVYMGIKITKYCPEHRGEEFRERTRYTTDPATTNRVIKHKFNYREETTVHCECCGEEFKMILLPRIEVYPKWCEKHRSAHKRSLYNKSHSYKEMNDSL